MHSKFCAACKQTKLLADFYRNKAKKDGLTTECKECVRERMREVARANPEANRSRVKAWYRANKDRALETRKRYHAANKKRLNKLSREYYRANKDGLLEYSKRYRKEHAEEKRSKDLAWRQANPEKVRRYRVVSEGRRRAQKSDGSVTARDIENIHNMQRGRCALCRCPLRDGYHADHIVALSRGGDHLPRNIQLLCPPCNVRKSAKVPEDFMRELGRLL